MLTLRLCDFDGWFVRSSCFRLELHFFLDMTKKTGYFKPGLGKMLVRALKESLQPLIWLQSIYI